MIDRVSIAVSDLSRSSGFYSKVLEPLGLTLIEQREATVGFIRKYPEFWLNLHEELAPAPDKTGAHICIRAPSEEAVTAFHDIAIRIGGRSDGAPGERRGAVTGYFAAFIRDPDGNEIEAITFPRTES